MRLFLFLSTVLLIAFGCNEKKQVSRGPYIIGAGQMPNLAKDGSGNLHLVFGKGDSILYCFSSDKGNTFSAPSLIAVLPHVYTFATRGPQITATENSFIVTACTSTGDIHSYYKGDDDHWTASGNVNDEDTVAKEGLMALSADANQAFAAWLDLRGNKRNKIVGARSTDGGKTWSKNVLVYASPDSSVCECCKPSVLVKGSDVYVMFRNWLNGNRDMYLAHSSNNGSTFEPAQKLGQGSWKFNACPMDGGGLSISKDGIVQTAWRREGAVYTAAPQHAEEEVGVGKGCTIESLNNSNVFAWTENGNVVVKNSKGQKHVLGKGSQPVLKAVDDQHVLCVWESEKQIEASVIAL